ncbi:unnamed protein product [Debaryomyces tyrocola]|nr:unnamed protein product [Debaryomyces tyrocola]
MSFLKFLFKNNDLGEEIPGTIHLIDVDQMPGISKVDSEKGNQNIMLHPRPSSNPNDPLRWLHRKKKLQLFLLTFWAFVQNISSVWTGPVYDTWVDEFNCTYNQLNIASGLVFVAIAVGCTTLQPIALKYGKRIVYIGCTVLQIIGNIVYSQAHNVETTYIASALVGFAAAPIYSLVEISSTDIFFQHERAENISWLVLALQSGCSLGPLAAGFITESLNWRWCCYIMVIIFSVLLIIQIFTMEDSTFQREESPEELEESIVMQIRSHESFANSIQHELSNQNKKRDNHTLHIQSDIQDVDPSIPKRTYLQRLRLIENEFNDPTPIIVTFLKPFYLVSFPIVVWCGILQGIQQMWLTLMTCTQSEFYSSAPYNFSSSMVGLSNLGQLVGIIAGMAYGGKFVDWLTIQLAKRNNGIMEPEFRLYSMAFPTLINAAGILTYCLGPAYKAHWFLSVGVGQCCLGFAMASVTSICYTYCSDSYPKLAGEGIVFISFLNNSLATVFTFTIQSWIDKDGLKLMAWLMFMLSLILNGSFIVWVFYGKRVRRWTKSKYYQFCDDTGNHP